MYNRRSIVEAVFSVIKRKFGEIVKARKYYNQVKEIKVKILVYNINKNIIYSFGLKLRISTKPNDPDIKQVMWRMGRDILGSSNSGCCAGSHIPSFYYD